MSRSGPKKKGSLKSKLTPAESILLKTRTRQLERTIKNPTRQKIYDALKNDVRWRMHKNDVLTRHIGKSMTVPEVKTPKKKKKPPQPSVSNISVTQISTSSQAQTFDGNSALNQFAGTINQQNGSSNSSQTTSQNVTPFAFGAQAKSQSISMPNTEAFVDLTKSFGTTPSSRIGYNFGRQKGRDRSFSKNKKRKFAEMNANGTNPNATNLSNKPKYKTTYVDDKAGRRGLTNHQHNAKAREQLEDIIKMEIAKKHRKKTPKSVDPATAAQHRGTLQNSGSISQQKEDGSDQTEWEPIYPTETLSDVGGLTNIKDKLDDLLVSLQCDIWSELGVPPPRSVLLHGPPGSGKTLLARAIAGQCQVGLLKVSAPELVAGISGQSEQKIRSLFQAGLDNEPCIIFIDEIDVIAGKREAAQRNMETRIVAQLLTSLDDIAREAMTKKVMFIAATNRPDSIDSALRRGDRFDYELTMGLPDEKARLKILNIITKDMKLEEGFNHKSIAEQTNGFVGADLKALTKTAGIIGIKRILNALDPSQPEKRRKLTMDENGDWNTDSDDGADDENTADPNPYPDDVNMKEKYDVVDLAGDESNGDEQQAADWRLDLAGDDTAIPNGDDNVDDADGNTPEPLDPNVEGEYVPPPYDRVVLNAQQLANECIKEADFEKALTRVEPSARREGFATIPDVTWDDIGALSHIRNELTLKITARIKFKKMFEKLQIDDPCGVLLFGPPGCGKTLLAKAIAATSGASFISIKGPELLNKFVGESERAIRIVFQRARTSPPCIVFFDELDALAPKREGSMSMGGSANNVNSRVVNQLLTEMDGTRDRGQVFVIGATNRYDIIDTALMRPGRLGTKIYVGLPDANGREEILKAHTRNKTLREDVNLQEIARDPRCERMSGADLANLVTEAAMNVIKKALHEVQSDGGIEKRVDGKHEEESDQDDMKMALGEGDEETQKEIDLSVSMDDFNLAMKIVKPSVTEQQAKEYSLMAELANID